MPYTLTKGLIWFILAFLLGAIIGWLLRSIRASRQVARARGEGGDTAEVEALRGRVANLEPLVGERDRLKAELDACRAAKSGPGGNVAGVAATGAAAAGAARPSAPAAGSGAAGSGAAGAGSAPAAGAAGAGAARPSAPAAGSGAAGAGSAPAAGAAGAGAAGAGAARPSAPAAGSGAPAGSASASAASAAPAAPAARPSAPAAGSGAPAGAAGAGSGAGAGAAGGSAAGAGSGAGAAGGAAAPLAATSGAALDMSAASAALGRKIKLDDLTVVEGIGPKISELCHGIGIKTWRALSETEPSLLRTMLHDAGPRFQMHDPTTWPQQAGLLAKGDWAAFVKLTDQLDGGRPEN